MNGSGELFEGLYHVIVSANDAPSHNIFLLLFIVKWFLIELHIACCINILILHFILILLID